MTEYKSENWQIVQQELKAAQRVLHTNQWAYSPGAEQVYSPLIRAAGKVMSFVILASFGFFLVGCISLMMQQFTLFHLAMALATKLLWRFTLISAALFITGVIVSSLTT